MIRWANQLMEQVMNGAGQFMTGLGYSFRDWAGTYDIPS